MNIFTKNAHYPQIRVKSLFNILMFKSYCACLNKLKKSSQRLAVKDVQQRHLSCTVNSDYKIYYVLETVPVVQKHEHFHKERTLPTNSS